MLLLHTRKKQQIAIRNCLTNQGSRTMVTQKLYQFLMNLSYHQYYKNYFGNEVLVMKKEKVCSLLMDKTVVNTSENEFMPRERGNLS